MKSVLLISRDFPPDGGPGVQRVAKWVKYLPERGWNPIVITGQPRPDIFPRDETLLGDVSSSEIKVIRCESSQRGIGGRAGSVLGRAYELLFRKFRPWSWPAAAYLGGLHAAKEFNCQAVLSSSYPVIVHDVAKSLAQQLRLPWIADVRDPLVGGRDWYYLSKKEKRTRQAAEKRMINSADAIINVHSIISDDLANRYPNVPGKRFHTILNGFDQTDFADFCASSSSRNEFVISFMGTLYQEMDFEPFRTAVESLCSADTDLRTSLRVRFYGRMNQQLENYVRQGSEAISYEGYISHEKVATVLAESDVLLLPTSPLPYGRFTCTGKVFEYIGTRKPILMLGPCSSPAAKIVQEANAGLVVDEADPAAISNAIRKLYDLRGCFQRKFYRQADVLTQYRRDVQASQLANILNEVVNRNRT